MEKEAALIFLGLVYSVYQDVKLKQMHAIFLLHF